MERRHIRRLRALFWRPGLAAARLIARLLSWRWIQRLSRVAGGLVWWASRVNRRRALAHLEIAFPDMPARERKALAREAFCQQVMSVGEVLHLSARGIEHADRHIEVEGWEHVARALDDPRPVLLITGHCGNWELMAVVFRMQGAVVTAVTRKMKEQVLDDIFERLRTSLGSQRLQRGEEGSVRELLGALRGGNAVMMLIDQDFRTDGVFVPFFGRLAHTPSGAARLACRGRTQALPGFLERREDGTHLARFGPPFELPGDVTEATAIMTRAIEEQIRRRPEQWVWWHRRWRRGPEGTG